MPSARLFILHTVQKKFREARLCKVVPLVPTVIQLRLLNSSYQKCRLGFLFCVLFSALSVMMLLQLLVLYTGDNK